MESQMQEFPLKSNHNREKSEDASDSSSLDQESIQKSAFALNVSKRQYLDEKTADVYFCCGPNRERIPAHRSVLSRASDAFYAMIYGPNAEDGDKELLTTSPEAFKIFLQFCYTDEVNLKVEHITEVMGLAHEYQMNECLDACGKFWAQHLTINDICWAYHWAIHYDVDGLKEFCERKISACPETLFKTTGFLSCEYIVFDHILSIDSLVCFELSVLEACLAWGQNACKRNGLDITQSENLRSQLKDSLYKIRFGSIDIKDFAQFTDTNPQLFNNSEDYEDIIRLFAGCKTLKTNRFNAEPRTMNIFTWDSVQHLKLDIIAEPWEQRITCTSKNTINLSANCPVLFGGFECTTILGTKHDSNPCATMCVTIVEMYKHHKRELLCEKYLLNSKSETFVDLHQRPFVMNPEYEYRIYLKMDNDVHVEYRMFEIENEYKLGENIIITIDTDVYGIGIDFNSIIKRFHFNSL